jgi:bacteriocin-like protein
MSNVNAERNVDAEPKPSVCELNEKELDVVSGGLFSAVVREFLKQMPQQNTTRTVIIG